MKYRSSSLTGDGITMAVAAGAATLRKTIEDDDAYVMGTADSLEVEKLSVRGTVGEVEQDENGKYKPETYTACASWRRLPTTPWAATL